MKAPSRAFVVSSLEVCLTQSCLLQQHATLIEPRNRACLLSRYRITIYSMYEGAQHCICFVFTWNLSDSESGLPEQHVAFTGSRSQAWPPAFPGSRCLCHLGPVYVPIPVIPRLPCMSQFLSFQGYCVVTAGTIRSVLPTCVSAGCPSSVVAPSRRRLVYPLPLSRSSIACSLALNHDLVSTCIRSHWKHVLSPWLQHSVLSKSFLFSVCIGFASAII